MTLSLVTVQSELITFLKSKATLLTLLNDPLEIREIEWVGGKYSYPNVRVRVLEFKRKDTDCDVFNVVASILVFGDDASSMKTNRIATEIFNLTDGKTIRNANINTATRMQAIQFGAEFVQDGDVWRSEVQLKFQAT